MDAECRVYAVGPAKDRESLLRAVEEAMGGLGLARAAEGRSPGAKASLHALGEETHFCVLEQATHASKVAALVGPEAVLYEIHLENGTDGSESHYGTIVGRVAESGELRAEHEVWEEGLVGGGMLAETAGEYLIEQIRQDLHLEESETLPEPLQLAFRARSPFGEPALDRAWSALRGVSTYRVEQEKGRIKIALSSPDGSRRYLFLSEAEWARVEEALRAPADQEPEPKRRRKASAGSRPRKRASRAKSPPSPDGDES